jgi:hypothetical protein
VKTWQLRSFLEDFLASQGVVTERKGENLLMVRPPRRLISAIGAKELVLAFNLRGVQEDPRSELGTVGNPVFDRILELARASGRVGQRFEVAPDPPRKPPDPAEHFQFHGRGLKVGPPTPTYSPTYFLVIRIEYSLEDLPDELEIIPVDGVSLQPLAQTPELAEYWESLAREAAPGRALQPAFPVPPPVVRASLRLLEKRLRKRVARIRRESEEHLNHESESIGNYYRQLIEETRNAGRRWALPAGGREERIRLLQLDWKRRVEEAQQYWHPSLDVRLAAVAAAQRPRLAYRVRLGSAAKQEDRTEKKRPARSPATRGPFVFWDETEKRFIDPPCHGCGTPGQVDLVPTESGFLCLRCSKLVVAPADR